MKKTLLLALFFGLFATGIRAQAPQAVCYQALAKDNQNNNIVESTIGIRATILRGSSNGIEEWIEIHSPQTDEFGLFTIEIGQGTPVGGGAQSSFSDINWGNGEFWLRIEFDPFNGGNFELMGANQIISVPYALYANGAGRADIANTALLADSAAVAAFAPVAGFAQAVDTANIAQIAITAISTVGDDDGDPENELQTLNFENGILSLLDPAGDPVGDPIPLATSSGGSLDDDPMNELQTLEFQNGELSLLDPLGNPVGDPIELGTSNDDDPENELQNLDTQNGELVLLNPDGSASGDGVAFDESDVNELQTLDFQNGVLSLLDPTGNVVGDPIPLATSNGGSLDDSPTNELQTLGTQNGELVLLNPGGTVNGNGVAFDESPTNELQELGLENGFLTLENPDGTTSPSDITIDTSLTNEIQTLSMDGGTISISGGNAIELMDSSLPFSAPGASFDLPQGILGEHIVVGMGNYTVPTGKTFWITAGGPSLRLKQVSIQPFTLHPTTPNMPVLRGGQSIENCSCTGILIDESANVEAVLIDFPSEGAYIVPDNKILFIKSGLKNDEIGFLVVDQVPMEFLRSNFTRGTRIITFPGGTTIEPLASQANELILTGFLVDEEF